MDNNRVFHRETNSVFNKSIFNKNKAKFFVIVAVIGYIILGVVNIYEYYLIKDTVSVVAVNGKLYENQQITTGNIKEYKMTRKEYYRSALVKNANGKIVRDVILLKEANSIIGKYSGYTKNDNEPVKYSQIMNSVQDNSRQILRLYPGKIIVPLSIKDSNLKVFNNILTVGDRINISCIYSSEANLITEAQEAKKSNNGQKVEVITTKPLFTGVAVGDILNSSGESLLDYYKYLNTLSPSDRKRIEASDAHAKKITVDSILMALTPSEVNMYYEYQNKNDCTFFVTMSNADDV